MIVTMKKLLMLFHHSDRDDLLAGLQKLGVVHVEEQDKGEKSALLTTQAALKEVQQVLRELPPLNAKDLEKLPEPQSDFTVYKDLIATFQKYKVELNRLDNELSAIEKDLLTLAPWGSYDPAVWTELAAAGLTLNCYMLRSELINSQEVGEALFIEIKRLAGFSYIVSTLPPEALPLAEHVYLPKESADKLKELAKTVRTTREILQQKIAALAEERPRLKRYEALLLDKLGFDGAKADLGSCLEGNILTLKGFFPAKSESDLRNFLADKKVYYEISPVPAGEAAPIKFKNNVFNRLFLPITEIYQLPDYHEVETTPFLAPFFTLFFGVCLGDVGYGALICLAALIALFKVPKNMRSMVGLVGVLGLATLAAGFLLNTFFGATLFGGPGTEGALLPDVHILPPLASYKKGGIMVYPAMSFALLCGFLQLSLGMIINMINSWRLNGPSYALRPLSSLLMFIGALIWAAKVNFLNMGWADFSLGERYPLGWILTLGPDWLGMALTFAGIFFLLFFGSPEKKFFIRPAVGLYDLYSFITGIMGDLLSYIRLFALGLGSGLVGASFNDLALKIITDEAGAIEWATPLAIFTILIMLLGHAINFALSLVSSFVHPLRLTFVEFYKNLGFTGGGAPYRPLALSSLSKKE